MNRSSIVLLFGWSAALLSLGMWGSDIFPQGNTSGNAGGNAFSHPGYVFVPCDAKAAPAPAPSTHKAVCTQKTNSKNRACKAAESAPQDNKHVPCAVADTLLIGQS